MSSEEPQRIDRRTAIKWISSAAFAAALAPRALDGKPVHMVGAGATVGGYGTDPDLVKIYHPGDLWPLTFTAAQRQTAAALCDFIIPADEVSPSAATLGVPDFIDEWISAPYPEHDKDRKIIIEGLTWIDAESQRRFGNDFVDLVHGQRVAIADDICFLKKAKPELKTAAKFFDRFRELTSGGFYSTPEGSKDIGYIGNVPLAKFEGPTLETRQRLGLE